MAFLVFSYLFVVTMVNRATETNVLLKVHINKAIEKYSH